jgi:hypothetical protein
MLARLDEGPQPRLRIGNGVRARDADRIEALRARRFDQRRFDGGRRSQKSRLA